MSKKIYLAGKLNYNEMSINDFANELEEKGHKINYKWWHKTPLPTPYLDNYDSSSMAAQEKLAAAYSSEVFILMPTDNILDAAVEFGTAIASKSTVKNKEVIIVNPYDVRQSVYYAHPFVIAVRSLNAIRERDWY